MWIYEHKDWPSFKYDKAALASALAELSRRQGRLLGRMESLGFELRQSASLVTLTDDVVKSCAIEGENLNSKEVRSSIARRLGMDLGGLIPSSRNVDGIVEIMLDATRSFAARLTKDRLFGWHCALFPTGRSFIHKINVGGWRRADVDPMQVVSGAIGREKIHFQAPAAELLEGEMQRFLDWFDAPDNTDPILRAGIAHFWFVTIHPFEDGNGRIARAIGDMALARADGIADRFYSMSSQIEAERKDYYNILEKQQRSSPDITMWLEWFLDCLGKAISRAEMSLANVIFKDQLLRSINQGSINDRQRMIINRMLDDDFKGHMNTSKYARITKCSGDTALRDIQDLKTRRIFIQNPGAGRSTSYRLPIRDELAQII